MGPVDWRPDHLYAMKNNSLLFLAGSAACLVGAGALIYMAKARGRGPITPLPHALYRAEPKIDRQLYSSNPKGAEKSYSAFIKDHQNSKTQIVQDEVAAARIRLGFLAAHDKDFKKARSVFLEASSKYQGSNHRNPAFGDLKDQAAYQAMVCLEAQGHIAQAQAEYRKFLRERIDSPLVFAVHRRLQRLHGGLSQEQDDRLLQSFVSVQQKRARFETAVCGPKAIEHLLALLGMSSPGYQAIAAKCGTTEKGTSIEGIRKGLLALGMRSFGYRLNRKDFATLKVPALWLIKDHYVVVQEIKAEEALVYDSTINSLRKFKLPEEADVNFTAAVITLSPPDIR